MQNHSGVFIVLEGSDGSGKGTQFKLLAERLKAVGHDVAVFDFPRYEEPSSHFVRRYLNGEYGPSSEVSPYTASIFYALDRYEASPQIKKAIKEGKVVLANRFVGSNMAHQGTKFGSVAEQRGFFMWADNMEYQLFGIPRPDINLFLKVTPEISFELIAKKAKRSYTSEIRDEHEADMGHIKMAVETYELLCKLMPRDFKEINCVRDGQIQTIVEINEMIWGVVKPLLPEPKRLGKGVIINLDRSGVIKGTEKIQKNTKPSSKQTVDNNTKFNKILELQKKMLTKANSLKRVNHSQLRAAISLVSPLRTRKDEISSLVKDVIHMKPNNDSAPVSLDKIIDEISGSMPTLSDSDGLQLMHADPTNEFEILGGENVDDLNYQQKQKILNSRLKDVGSKFVYDFETVSDFSLMLLFKAEVYAKHIEVMTASPVPAHKTPEIIEVSGLDESFNRAFEVSSEIYRKSLTNRDSDALYDLLLGHSVRWKFMIDAAAISRALQNSKEPQLLNFLGQISDKIAEKHPLVAMFLANKKPVMVRSTHKKRR